MARVKLNDGSRAKYKAVSRHLSDYFGFKPSEDGSVSSVENICCMTLFLSAMYKFV